MTEIEQLPEIVRTYLTAHRDRDEPTAITAFTADATVTDEGRTYRGLDEIRGWLQHAASAYTYTTELTGVRRVDDDRWLATHHLEGNFPGGVVDLHFDFTLARAKIQRLEIAP